MNIIQILIDILDYFEIIQLMMTLFLLVKLYQ